MSEASGDLKVPKAFRFNPDVAWQEFVYKKFKSLTTRIAFKYCMNDEDLREDLEQEAMISLMTIFPSEINGYQDYVDGNLTEKQWNAKVDTYCRQVIRNSVLSVLGTTSSGNWYVGRKKRRKNPTTGAIEYVSTPAIYTSLDAMLSSTQIGTDGILYVSGVQQKPTDNFSERQDTELIN